MNPFETRRREDPQGVINDLLGQTTRQGQAISKYVELQKGLLTLDEVKAILPILQNSNLAFPHPTTVEETIAKLVELEKNLTPAAKEKKKKEPKDKTLVHVNGVVKGFVWSVGGEYQAEVTDPPQPPHLQVVGRYVSKEVAIQAVKDYENENY
jgi:hypothetical protein